MNCCGILFILTNYTLFSKILRLIGEATANEKGGLRLTKKRMRINIGSHSNYNLVLQNSKEVQSRLPNPREVLPNLLMIQELLVRAVRIWPASPSGIKRGQSLTTAYNGHAA